MVKAKIKILKIDDMNLKNISEQIDKTQQLNDILNKLDKEENFDDEIWRNFPFRKAN
ncbi:hypothetical protein [Rickettsia bellii]|uniref:hypothetical protein n=1 Tax=Rickettsia bellii TaxID=33990 RepID=UPI00164F3A77|nr:hypothetical protein [Rickettsia bellii]